MEVNRCWDKLAKLVPLLLLPWLQNPELEELRSRNDLDACRGRGGPDFHEGDLVAGERVDPLVIAAISLCRSSIRLVSRPAASRQVLTTAPTATAW